MAHRHIPEGLKRRHSGFAHSLVPGHFPPTQRF